MKKKQYSKKIVNSKYITTTRETISKKEFSTNFKKYNKKQAAIITNLIRISFRFIFFLYIKSEIRLKKIWTRRLIKHSAPRNFIYSHPNLIVKRVKKIREIYYLLSNAVIMLCKGCFV